MSCWNEVKRLAKSLAESTERSFTCFEIFSGKALNNTSPPYSRRNDKNMMIVTEGVKTSSKYQKKCSSNEEHFL